MVGLKYNSVIFVICFTCLGKISNGLLLEKNSENTVTLFDKDQELKITDDSLTKTNRVEEDECPNVKDGGRAVSIQCGGVLVGRTGIISYKLGIPFDMKEICTWTVYAPQSSIITFQIDQDGIIEADNKIKIGYFLDADYKSLGNFQEVVLRYDSENKTITVPGPVAFVRFYSNSQMTGLGFRISYCAEKSSLVLPFKFNNFFYSAPYGRIRYPPGNSPYSQLERVSFVLRLSSPSYLALKFFDGNCGVEKDYLTIYLRDDGQQLVSIQQFCNSSVSAVPRWSVIGEVLVTFHSSISGQNRGFDLIWVPYTN